MKKKAIILSVIVLIFLFFTFIGPELKPPEDKINKDSENFSEENYESNDKKENIENEKVKETSENNYASISCTTKAVPDPEYDNIVFTLPDCASKKRIRLPAEIEDFIIDGELKLFGYGMHAGAHPEGLDHVWTTIRSDAYVKAMADGQVISIMDAPVNEQGHIININHGEGFSAWYMGLTDILVKKGDKIEQGQNLGKGVSHVPGSAGLELTVFDDSRSDGIYFFSEGYTVSPYDYLEEDQKRELVEAYKKYVLEPFRRGEKELKKPDEIYLTNSIFLHKKGKIEGVWYLYPKKWCSGKPYDLFTFIETNNEFFKGNRFIAINDNMEESGDWGIEGDYEIDYESNRFILTVDKIGKKYYGIFEVDDTGERAKLKIQYQENDYPSGFTNPETYIQRSNLMRREDAGNLGVREHIELNR